MIKLELSHKQTEELKNFYSAELKTILKRADELKDLLNKLEQNPVVEVSEGVISSNGKKKSLIRKQPAEGISDLKFRKTKNPNWRLIVLEILKEKQKPVSIDEIIQTYEKTHKGKISGNKKFLNSLTQALFRLRTVDKKINSIKIKGQKQKLYSLLGNNAIPVKDATAIKSKTVVPAKANSNIQMKEYQKRGRKPKEKTDDLTKFIVETLRKTKRVMTELELLKYAMVYFGLPRRENKIMKGKLRVFLNDLAKNERTVSRVKKEGRLTKLWALPEWVDEESNLITEYK